MWSPRVRTSARSTSGASRAITAFRRRTAFPATTATIAKRLSPARMDRQRCPVCMRSEEHTSELQSHSELVCRLLLEKKKIAHEPASIADAAAHVVGEAMDVELG